MPNESGSLALTPYTTWDNVKSLQSRGMKQLTVDQLVNLKIHGID